MARHQIPEDDWAHVASTACACGVRTRHSGGHRTFVHRRLRAAAGVSRSAPPPAITVLECFAGIGGLSLGLERAGMTVVGQIEIDGWCQQVLAKHWPGVPRHDDINTAVPWWGGRFADVISGGPPCQPNSFAGRGRAQADPRWLWPQMRDLIASVGPRAVIIEGVPGLRARGLIDILHDLHALGYHGTAGVLSAAEMGAPHLRKRIFVVAYAQRDVGHACGVGDPGQGARGRHGGSGGGPDVAHAGRAARGSQAGHANAGAGGEAVPQWPTQPRRRGDAVADAGGAGLEGPGQLRDPGTVGGGQPADGGWWAVEPAVGRVAHGVPARVDRLGGLGNAVVPQCAEFIGRLVVAHLVGPPTAADAAEV